MDHERYSMLETELPNPDTAQIDRCGTLEMLSLINSQDMAVAYAVKNTLEFVAAAVDEIYKRLCSGGRLFYIGAGTSGMLGAMDAFECRPTYGICEEMVQSFTAGTGSEKEYLIIEQAEDDGLEGKRQLEAVQVCKKDAVVGISASGSAGYVIEALRYARTVGACTIGIVNNPKTEIHKTCDICIAALTGPEVIAGSTRMKAGTAQKMILNMISTAVMIKMGKVYGNLMAEVGASNRKMRDRAVRIVALATGVSYNEAESCLVEAGYNVKTAIMMKKSGLSREAANSRINAASGRLSEALARL